MLTITRDSNKVRQQEDEVFHSKKYGRKNRSKINSNSQSPDHSFFNLIHWATSCILINLSTTHLIHLIIHSVRRLFTGLAVAALIAWKLIVNKVISITDNPAMIYT